MAPKSRTLLQCLYDPAERGLSANLDLVLVHGLNGDKIQTWTHEKSMFVWPRDLLPRKQPCTRVLSFGYNAQIFHNNSVAAIRDHARNVLTRLEDLREDVDESRPIVFVAHSLGGLIVKQALRFAHNEKRYNSIASATRGLLFFGVPHSGADEERWMSIAQGFARMEGAEWKVSPLVSSLTSGSRYIVEICEDFCELARQYGIVSFYETEAWPGTDKLIVDKMSAVMMLEHEERVPIDSDHAGICRFEDEEDPDFLLVCKRISRAAKGTAPGTGNVPPVQKQQQQPQQQQPQQQQPQQQQPQHWQPQPQEWPRQQPSAMAMPHMQRPMPPQQQRAGVAQRPPAALPPRQAIQQDPTTGRSSVQYVWNILNGNKREKQQHDFGF